MTPILKENQLVKLTNAAKIDRTKWWGKLKHIKDKNWEYIGKVIYKNNKVYIGQETDRLWEGFNITDFAYLWNIDVLD